jgi:Icc-related predicted phosphoesterase
MTKALFFTDVHGNRAAYQAAAEIKDDLIILGGDLFPTGNVSADEQARFVRSFLASWVKRVGVPVYAVPGNHDSEPAVRACEEIGIRMTHRAPAPLPGGRTLVGYPYVPITPFVLKDWEKIDSEPEPPFHKTFYLTGPDGRRRPGDWQADIVSRGTIRDDLQKLPNDPRAIFLIHTPPARTNLDIIYGGQHVGSQAWREFIERAQPPLTLHGHIHEAPELSGQFTHRLGKTLCINPGDSTRKLQAVTFDLDDPAATLQRIA